MTDTVDIDAIRGHAQSELERWQVPALELVALRDGEVLLADAFGLRDVAAGLPATPFTRFHHGSTGKAFTGVLAGTLVDAGLLEWDRPIRDYLPDFRLHEGLLGDRVTAADLLSHRSGLARHEYVWLANPSLDRAELVRRLRYLPSGFDLRTSFEYSNLGYTTVGHLIGALTGSTWEEQLRRRVLEPLDMCRTTTSVDEAQAAEHAQPYVQSPDIADDGQGSGSEMRSSEDVEWTAIPWRRSDTIAPAGGVISCAVDTARWLQLQLGGGEVDGKRVISDASLDRTRHLHTPIDAPGQDPDIRYYGYAFGWLVGAYRGRRFVWHNGGIDGFKTDMAILPDDNVAVAACCNVLSSDLPLAMVLHVVDTLIEVAPKPWSETFLAAQQDRPKSEEPEAVEGTQPSHPLEAYEGDYCHPGYGTLHVGVNEGEMLVRLGELDLVARYRHYDTWMVEYEPLQSSFAMTFLTDADGRVCAAELPLEPSVAPIRFEIAAKETER